jgi:PKD repeat protein
MDQNSHQMEKIFRDAFEQHTMEPSPKVLKRIKFELWKKEFFSVKPYKFNIVYSTLILGSAISFCVLAPKTNLFTKKNNVLATPAGSKESGNSGISESNRVTVKNENKSSIKNTSSEMMLSAAFETDESVGCVPLTVHFKNHSIRANSYKWEFGNGENSTYQNPTYTYTQPGEYLATLTVKGKEGNTDAFTKEIKVLNRPEAAIDIDVEKSEISSKKVVFKNLSKDAKSYQWDFGDQNKSLEKDAVHKYENFATYKVTLVAENKNGCTDTASLNNHFIDKNYELAFPFSFKPNTNDPGNNGFYASADAEGFVFYPKNYGTKIYELKIFAPNGMEVFNTTNIQQGWNGYIKGRLAPAGIYNYSVKGIYPNGKPFDLRGTFKVIVEDYDMN